MLRSSVVRSLIETVAAVRSGLSRTHSRPPLVTSTMSRRNGATALPISFSPYPQP